MLLNLEKKINKWKIYFESMTKWIIVAVLTGVTCGVIGSLFKIGVGYATGFRSSYNYILFFLPIIGLLIGKIYHLAGTAGRNPNDIIEQVQNGEGLIPRLIPAIFFATFLTHLGGGSAGEGAALQMGGTVGFTIGKWIKLDDKDLRTITITGIAAYFAALFNTPVAATIFAMGVITVGVVYHVALLPSLAASIIAFKVSNIFGLTPKKFAPEIPNLEVLTLLKVIILSILCAAVAVLLCKSIHLTRRFAEEKIPNEWIRVIVGSILIVILSIVFSSGDYNGGGSEIISGALQYGEAVPYAFLVKIIFTSITLAVGFKGGEIVPSFFIGATFGCTAGQLLGLPTDFAAALGMVCVFCAATNTPLASIFLSVELFGGEGIIFFAIGCAFAYVLSGYNGLYSSQKILYSKLKAQYINVYANAHREGETTEAEKKYS